jgi:hypothetical protein
MFVREDAGDEHMGTYGVPEDHFINNCIEAVI